MESTRTPSRSKTPWDDADETSLSPLEIYLRDKYKDHFNEHHPMLSETDEYKYLNSIPVTKCRLCGSLNIVKNGYTKGNLTRYLCKDCHHTFVITTRTIFENHKLPIEEWIEFCLNLFGFGSTSLTS